MAQILNSKIEDGGNRMRTQSRPNRSSVMAMKMDSSDKEDSEDIEDSKGTDTIQEESSSDNEESSIENEGGEHEYRSSSHSREHQPLHRHFSTLTTYKVSLVDYGLGLETHIQHLLFISRDLDLIVPCSLKTTKKK